MSNKTLATCTLTIVLLLSKASTAQTFVSFDYPGAASTTAFGLNNSGAVVGSYVDSSNKTHGFLLKGGTFQSIDYDGAIATDARGINADGDIVGTHVDAAGQPGGGLHGYLLRQGAFTALDYPGHMNTILQHISDAGEIVGCYHDTDTMGTMHGILISDGNFSELSMQASMNNGVAAGGNITTGLYTDMMTNVSRSYISANGAFAPFDFPFAIATSVWDMNARGDIAGVYTDASKKVHGFILSLGDFVSTFGVNPSAPLSGPFEFVSIDYPGAATTRVFGINRRGDVVGAYVDSAGKTHGFFRGRARRQPLLDNEQ